MRDVLKSHESPANYANARDNHELEQSDGPDGDLLEQVEGNDTGRECLVKVNISIF